MRAYPQCVKNQNTFGETFTDVLEDATVMPNVGWEQGGRLIATGSFPAPATTGTYQFHLADGVANVLLEVNTPPVFSRVIDATVDVATSGTLTFTVE